MWEALSNVDEYLEVMLRVFSKVEVLFQLCEWRV